MINMKTENAKFAVFVLRCLLNYHERMLAGTQDLRVDILDSQTRDTVRLGDMYSMWSEGLKEAIRCVMIVHSGKVRSFPEWEKWVGLQEEPDPPADDAAEH